MSGFYGFRNIARQRLAFRQNKYYINYVSVFFIFSVLTSIYIIQNMNTKYVIYLKILIALIIFIFPIYITKVLNSIPEKEINVETEKIISPNQFYGRIQKIKGWKALLIFFIPAIIIVVLSVFLPQIQK
jgi:hypothetical protein